MEEAWLSDNVGLGKTTLAFSLNDQAYTLGEEMSKFYMP